MARLVALLVGIDNYAEGSEVAALRGCVNDIDHWERLLLRYGPAQLRHLSVLRNAEATYTAVLERMREVIAQLLPGDDFCFVFCGHGSREPAAPHFAEYFAEGLQETLVCYDSRLPGGLDLADKELLYLLDDAAGRGARLTVVLDCCHSGSGTRMIAHPGGVRVRRTPTRLEPRRLETYLDGRIQQAVAAAGGNDYRLPNPPHLLVAACRRDEEARELPNHRGLLSSLLTYHLTEASGGLTHAQLYRRLTVGAQRITAAQHPQLEVHGDFDASGGFLGAEVRGKGKGYPVGQTEQGEWYVPTGAKDGLAVDNPQRITFRVVQADGETVRATASRVEFDRTLIDLPATVADGLDLVAELSSLPVPGEPVLLRVDEQWNTPLLGRADSPFYTLSPEATAAAYRIEQTAPAQLSLLRSADDVTLYTAYGSDTEAVTEALHAHTERVLRWEYLLALGNDYRPTVGDSVELLIETKRDGRWVRPQLTEDAALLALDEGEAPELPFRIVLNNRHPHQQLHAALFFTTDNYTFHFTGFNQPLPPASTTIAWDTLPDGSPTRFAATGGADSVHYLKVFVATSPLDVTDVQQQGFPLGKSERFSATGSRGVPGIDTFINRAGSREWWGQYLRVRVLEQQPEIGVTGLSLLGGAVKVAGRKDGFRARLTLGQRGAVTRGLEAAQDPLYRLLERQDGVKVARITATSSRGTATDYTYLELSDIEGAEALAVNPLEVELELAGTQEERFQAVTVDDGHVLPVGEFVPGEVEGRQQLRLHHLPRVAADRRSLLGAVKLTILKFVLRQPGHRLRWVDYGDGLPRRRSGDVRARVQAAKRILLVVHGIIGDTAGMAAFCQPLVEQGTFDLVLTFDYENLRTPLEETSRALEEALLQEAGITNDQHLTVLAHSMGGLVTRYFIEYGPGRQLVDRLIMAGTPNAGSDIAKLTKARDGATVLLGMAINLGWSIPAAALVAAALKGSKQVTVTLEQMLPESSYLRQLRNAPDPGIPYYVVAGDLEDYLDDHAETRNLLDKLYGLGGRLFYQNRPNDLAVSIASIQSVPPERQPLSHCREVDCHHLNYFLEAESTEVLYELLTN